MVDKCIKCGIGIPEGRQICPVCSGEMERRQKERDENYSLIMLLRTPLSVAHQMRQL